MKILAVDDDPVLIDMLKGLLDRAGFEDVRYCLSAQEALVHLATGCKVDCFLLDIRMPGKDGITLCKEIRQMPHHVETPIIMLTAVADIHSIKSAYAAGATEYVTKPFDGLALGSRIRTAIQLNDARARADHWVAAASQIAAFPQDAVPAISGDVVPYLGVPRAVEFFQLENILLRLDFGLYSTSILSIKIAGLSNYFRQSNDIPRQQQIIASLMAKVVEITGDDCLVSSAGDGVFVCVNFERKFFKASALRNGLEEVLLQNLGLSSEIINADFGIDVIRDFKGQMLTGRKAADLLRDSIRRFKVSEMDQSSEIELRRLFQVGSSSSPVGQKFRSFERVIPRKVVVEKSAFSDH